MDPKRAPHGVTAPARVRRSCSGGLALLQLFCWGLAVLSLLLLASPASAQDDEVFPVVGYITAVQAHGGAVTEFDVNAQHVRVSDSTLFGLIGSLSTTNAGPLRSALRVGAYVKVVGKTNGKTKTTIADRIYLRPDWDAALTGIGVIDKVLKPAPEPVFRADGYFVRITNSTQITFAPGVSSLQGVGVDSWVSFQGRQSPSGDLVASKAVFMPAQSTLYRSMFGHKQNYAANLIPATEKNAPPPPEDRDSDGNQVADPESAPAIDPRTGMRVDFEKILDKDGNLTQSAGIRMGTLKTWHLIPAATPEQRAMQARVRRIGERLIPAYQKALAPDDPAKIRFQFYAVEDKGARADLCPSIGLILVPVQVIQRLQNDDQLAAVIAGGIAYNMQRQAARRAAWGRKIVGPAIAANLAVESIPFVNLVPILTERKAANALLLEQMEERGRISMGLLADAGYDPWQVAEAWRLLAPKHQPSKAASVAYNDYAGYLLSILNLEYPKGKPAAS